MARGINPAITVSYVLKEDRELPEDERSVFHVKPIPAKVQADLQDGLFSFGGNIGKVADGGDEAFNEVKYHAGKVQLETLLHGLMRVEHYQIPTPLDAKRVSFKDLDWNGNLTRTKKLELLDFIAPKHRAEVARAIDNLSTLSEEEAKNSEGQ